MIKNKMIVNKNLYKSSFNLSNISCNKANSIKYLDESKHCLIVRKDRQVITYLRIFFNNEPLNF